MGPEQGRTWTVFRIRTASPMIDGGPPRERARSPLSAPAFPSASVLTVSMTGLRPKSLEIACIRVAIMSISGDPAGRGIVAGGITPGKCPDVGCFCTLGLPAFGHSNHGGPTLDGPLHPVDGLRRKPVLPVSGL